MNGTANCVTCDVQLSEADWSMVQGRVFCPQHGLDERWRLRKQAKFRREIDALDVVRAKRSGNPARRGWAKEFLESQR